MVSIRAVCSYVLYKETIPTQLYSLKGEYTSIVLYKETIPSTLGCLPPTLKVDSRS